MRSVTYNVMGYKEFEKLVETHYGHPFEFVADQECGNDSDHAFNNIKGQIGDWEEEELKAFKSTGVYGRLACTLLEDLVKNKVFSAGNYLITVCW